MSRLKIVIWVILGIVICANCFYGLKNIPWITAEYKNFGYHIQNVPFNVIPNSLGEPARIKYDLLFWRFLPSIGCLLVGYFLPKKIKKDIPEINLKINTSKLENAANTTIWIFLCTLIIFLTAVIMDRDWAFWIAYPLFK